MKYWHENRNKRVLNPDIITMHHPLVQVSKHHCVHLPHTCHANNLNAYQNSLIACQTWQCTPVTNLHTHNNSYKYVASMSSTYWLRIPNVVEHVYNWSALPLLKIFSFRRGLYSTNLHYMCFQVKHEEELTKSSRSIQSIPYWSRIHQIGTVVVEISAKYWKSCDVRTVCNFQNSQFTYIYTATWPIPTNHWLN